MAASGFVCLVMLVTIQQVFSRDCSDIESIMNCNECIRCGGHWCKQLKMDTARCSPERYDGWCPDEREELLETSPITRPGNAISLAYSEQTATIGVLNRMSVVYKSSTELKTDLLLVNTTQGFDLSLDSKTKCSGDQCTVTVETIPGKDFCSPNSRKVESVAVRLNVAGLEEDVDLKFNVPCACECNEVIEKDSSICNHQGDFSCGVCFCKNGWTGEFCDSVTKCESNRGDIECTYPAGDLSECNHNGYCSPCQKCECFTDRPGSRYFDRQNQCSDLCMLTSTCDDCLRNPDLDAPCFECTSPIVFKPLDRSVLQNKDASDKYLWVKCNETLFDGCYIEYAAMKEYNVITVMMLSFCDASASPVVGSFRITVPVILGVVAILAAAAAAAGYMARRARAPPLPLTDSQYQNIGAEDCVGENPLYKPPTSSFKNPTYGKW